MNPYESPMPEDPPGSFTIYSISYPHRPGGWATSEQIKADELVNPTPYNGWTVGEEVAYLKRVCEFQGRWRVREKEKAVFFLFGWVLTAFAWILYVSLKP